MYRAMFGLPACTSASGCLRIINVDGTASPLPTAADKGWNLETALDVDMVSAGCPLCKIVVVQVNVPGNDLVVAQQTAALFGANAISNSWGSSEADDVPNDQVFDQIGVGIFASSGDHGFDAGPQYPATSPHVIAVGGTHVQDDPVTQTATQTAWSDSGSSCSTEFAAPAFQPATAACAKRAAADVSAVADPQTGVALYCTAAGGFTSAGGTSASSPLVAALMAASGHADAAPAFVYRHPEAFDDVVGGTNGECTTTMCEAGSGWDGPTGLGTPDQSVLVTIGNGSGPAVTITAPADGSTEPSTFTVSATVASGATHVDLAIDGLRIGGLKIEPYTFDAPALTPGSHVVQVTSYTDDDDVGSAQITVDVPAATPDAGVTPGGGAASSGGGCATTGASGGAAIVILGTLAALRRRRRPRADRLP